MAETFDPPVTPSFGLSESTTTRVLRADFGDGYSQRTVDGLNSSKRSVPLTFDTLSAAEAAEIVDFFKARNGSESFYYTMPFDSTASLWVASSWTREWVSASTMKVTVTFTEEFDIV